MKVDVVAVTSFVHGHLDVHEGQGFPLEKGLAEELERSNLVRIKRRSVAVVLPKETPTPTAEIGPKARDDGAGPLSSALPAAPASPTQTSKPSALGGRHRRRSSSGA